MEMKFEVYDVQVVQLTRLAFRHQDGSVTVAPDDLQIPWDKGEFCPEEHRMFVDWVAEQSEKASAEG